MASHNEVFREKSASLQELADFLPDAPHLYDVNLLEPLEIQPQMLSFGQRLRSYAFVRLGQTRAVEVDSYFTAVRDTATALNGVKLKTELAEPEATPDTRLLVARNSYPVLVRFALDQELRTEPGLFGESLSRFIHPDVLEYVGGENPKITVSPGVSSKGNRMECPAFVGKNNGMPRLPYYLWHGAINIYDALGEFGETPRSQATLAAAEAALSAEA